MEMLCIRFMFALGLGFCSAVNGLSSGDFGVWWSSRNGVQESLSVWNQILAISFKRVNLRRSVRDKNLTENLLTGLKVRQYVPFSYPRTCP